MAGNRGVVYLGTHDVEVQSIDFPKMVTPRGKRITHGVILKVITTNICGSDQHMVRGRTTAPKGMVLGHEITGEIIEKGKDVEYLDIGDLVTVPFNVACGRCRNCRAQETGVCLNVNPKCPGGAYGYVDMGDWIGGQAEFVMVPFADFNLIKFPDKAQAMEKIRDLTMLSDILPTGFHGAVNAGVCAGSIVYVAGAGPVGMCAAASAHLLGAAVVLIGDMNKDRLKHARKMGFEPIDLTKSAMLEDLIEAVVGEPEVDASIDCVGFEAHGHGPNHGDPAPADVINSLMSITRASGGIGVPGVYVTEDPGADTNEARHGDLLIKLGEGWGKAQRILMGQTPVLRYNQLLMTAILHDRLPIGKILNTTIIKLDQAPQGYKDFDQGVAKKFVIDPHGSVKK